METTALASCLKERRELKYKNILHREVQDALSVAENEMRADADMAETLLEKHVGERRFTYYQITDALWLELLRGDHRAQNITTADITPRASSLKS